VQVSRGVGSDCAADTRPPGRSLLHRQHPEEIVDRVRTNVLSSGIDHVTLALADRRLALDWAGIDLPDLPSLDDQVRLIGTRILPGLMAP
jgi:hypothetical protein